MRDHDVSVDQGVVRRAIEAAIQPGLLDFQLAVVFGPGPGPRRLIHLSSAGVPGRATDPREDVSKRVVPADDEAADAAGEGVKPVSVELLQALSPCRSRSILLN